jgi:hypothetical protein
VGVDPGPQKCGAVHSREDGSGQIQRRSNRVASGVGVAVLLPALGVQEAVVDLGTCWTLCSLSKMCGSHTKILRDMQASGEEGQEDRHSPAIFTL